MKAGILKRSKRWQIAVVALAFTLMVVAGCRTQAPAPTDQQIATNVQTKISGESALTGQNIQVSVANGVATLSGTVADPASRALAGNDTGSVAGVKTVVNNLTVQPVATSVAPVEPQKPEPRPAARREARRAPAPVAMPAAEPQPMQQAKAAPAPMPAAPAAPAKPVVKEVTLPVGTIIPVRISEKLSSKDAQPNDVFHGSLASDLGTRGVIVLRQGTPVLGRVVDAREAAHFKGNSLLSLELTQITAGGRKIALVTAPYVQAGQGRGKNTAEKAGGGAVVGAIIGALSGGGKGAAIGTVAGGAAGAGVNAVTRGEQVEIASETLIRFHLQSPVTMMVTTSGGEASDSNPVAEPQLENRQ
ncbi:MAG: BON domain-containing protein [Acidobacteriota bacterium]